MKKTLTSMVLMLAGMTLLTAQIDLTPERFAFEENPSYREGIPSPAEFLGYELGEEFTLYAHAVAYFEALAAASPRVRIHQYGETYEGRPLINLVVTSEGNQQNLEVIRQTHLRLTDPAALTAAEAEELIADQPVFTSFSYNIHGNEASSTEAAMQVAYHLAASTDPAIQEVLDHSVIIMFVCINPDGRDRYVYWYNGMRRSVVGVQPRDLEHYEPWPNGRTNHYWFDLNRDWVWGVHPESRGHTAEYQRWMPQVHVDYHEQGYNSNYFTAPGTTPRNQLLPDSYEAWSDTFGRANVLEFDKHQLNYFTRDAFDFFYPGYGSSYPSVNGAIGMLTEQGGIGAGRAIETDDGYILLFRQRIFDHYKTSLATIGKAAERRRELLRYSYEAWQPSNTKSDTRAYILPDNDQPYLNEVIRVLLHHGVEVQRAAAGFNLTDARDFRSGKTARRSFPAGTYVISAGQPRHLFVHSVLERNLAIEDSVMYDMATWSAPLAYNLEAYDTRQGSGYGVQLEKVTEAPAYTGMLNNPGAQYAYVINWRQRFAPRALAMLWEKGYRVRSALEPFSDGERAYPEGTLIILKGRNLEKADEIEKDMQTVAEATGVVIDGFDTGRMLDGYDLASTKNRPVKQPKVAMLVDPPFSAYTCGQIYFLFDQETRMPIERIRTSILRQTAVPKFGSRYGLADLNDYDVLILADGGSHLGKVFDKEKLAELKAWIEAGGVLVATEDAAPFFTEEKSKFSKVKLQTPAKDSSEQARYLSYDDRSDYYGKKRIPGSALQAQIDVTNPLAFGMDRELYTLKFGADALAPSPDLQTVGHYAKSTEDLLVAGYASEENLRHLAGQTFAGVLPMGQGKVVFLVDNTQYRMFWRGPSRMMQNAVMLLPGF